MTTTKLPPPRKLTESEDIDSFELMVPGKSVANLGLATELQATNLTCLLRALATHAVGPYIKTNITDKAKSLDDVKNEFLKFLEIEVNDFMALHWFTIQRKQTERPLVFC